MLRIAVGSLALFGVVVGGFALVRVGPVLGPINFNSGLKEYTEYDVQKARADRVAAELKAETAAKKRIEAEEKATKLIEQKVEQRGFAREFSVEVAVGTIYFLTCRITSNGLEMMACYKIEKTWPCPRTGKYEGWVIVPTLSTGEVVRLYAC